MDLALKFNIPELRLDRQAREEDLPERWFKWGQDSRKLAAGAVHYYSDDYRFAALAKDPACLLDRPVKVAVELNFSTWQGSPKAVALADIYWKRSASRTWQDGGIRILVDCNVNDDHWDIFLLGVPRGWRAYATRVHPDTPYDELDRLYDLLRDHSMSDSPLLQVFGGGPETRVRCRENGWRWSPARGPWRKRSKNPCGV